MHGLRKMAAGLAIAVTGLQAAPAKADEFKRIHEHVKVDDSLQDSAGNRAGVRVGVIDTDIDVDHREFADRIVKAIQDPDYPYLPPGNHGTQVTGVIAAARDGRGMVGIAPEAKIVSTWLLDEDGDVPFTGPGGSLVSWFRRMEERKVNVVNASLGPIAGAGEDALKAMKNMRKTLADRTCCWIAMPSRSRSPNRCGSLMATELTPAGRAHCGRARALRRRRSLGRAGRSGASSIGRLRRPAAWRSRALADPGGRAPGPGSRPRPRPPRPWCSARWPLRLSRLVATNLEVAWRWRRFRFLIRFDGHARAFHRARGFVS